MKFVVLGTSEFTLSCARALIDSGVEVGALITLPKKALPLNSADISGFAKNKKIPYHKIEDINSSHSLNLIKSYAPDYIFSSWPKLLGKAVLGIPKRYTIGTHPTDLPFNRGRHPLHWLIALGIPRTKLSFFVMDEGVDTGRILLQIPFKVAEDDTIGEIVFKMNRVAYTGTRRLCKHLFDDLLYNGVNQEHCLANYWRKRTPHDTLIDVRMSTDMILRTVRSFAPPYPCAKLIFEKYILKISRATIVKKGISLGQIQRMEHGKILYARGNKIRVKVEDGIIELICQGDIPLSLAKAKYIYPPSQYILAWPERLKLRLS